MPPKVIRRGIISLERAGLISVERPPGQRLRVVPLPVPESLSSFPWRMIMTKPANAFVFPADQTDPEIKRAHLVADRLYSDLTQILGCALYGALDQLTEAELTLLTRTCLKARRALQPITEKFCSESGSEDE
jgi:hypothetical protein